MPEVECSKLKIRRSTESAPDASVDCLRVSVTDRCDLRCAYCMPRGGVPRLPRCDVMRFEDIVAVVRFLRDHYGLQTVRLTGGEPLVRAGIVDLAGMLSGVGLEDLALTTNGQRLCDLATPLREAGVSRVNISLDSLDFERYARLTCGGRLDRTLAGIEAARAAGFRSIKLNTVILRGENDSEVRDLVRFAMARGLEIRFLELMAIGVAAGRHASWFVSSREVLGRLREEFRLVAVKQPCQERTRIFLAEDSSGRNARVGFISPETQPFCSSCRRLRLTSDGRLLGCLMHSTGPDLSPFLRGSNGPDYAGLDRAIRTALGAKPTRRTSSSPRLMAGIGG